MSASPNAPGDVDDDTLAMPAIRLDEEPSRPHPDQARLLEEQNRRVERLLSAVTDLKHDMRMLKVHADRQGAALDTVLSRLDDLVEDHSGA